MNDQASFIEALASLAWPIIAVVAIVLLFPTLRRVVRDRPFSIKIGAFEMTAQEASEALLKQITDLQNEVGDLRRNVEGLRPAAPTPPPPAGPAPPAATRPPDETALWPEHIDDTIPPEAGVTPIAPPPAAPAAPSGAAPDVRPAPPHEAPSAILWVDERPEHNAVEIARLTSLGYNITTARSTKQAVDQLHTRPNRFGVLITDLGRGVLRRTAGLDTIREARALGFRGTSIVYTSPADAHERAADAAAVGASITGSPTELARLIERGTLA